MIVVGETVHSSKSSKKHCPWQSEKDNNKRHKNKGQDIKLGMRLRESEAWAQRERSCYLSPDGEKERERGRERARESETKDNSRERVEEDAILSPDNPTPPPLPKGLRAPQTLKPPNPTGPQPNNVKSVLQLF